jgi:hypothetical protein
MTVTPPGDVYPGPLRRFLAAVAGDPVVERWWREGSGPLTGRYAHLWDALSLQQRTALLSGNLDDITGYVDEEARKFPKPGEEDVSALGQAWALVRV